MDLFEKMLTILTFLDRILCYLKSSYGGRADEYTPHYLVQWVENPLTTKTTQSIMIRECDLFSNYW